MASSEVDAFVAIGLDQEQPAQAACGQPSATVCKSAPVPKVVEEPQPKASTAPVSADQQLPVSEVVKEKAQASTAPAVAQQPKLPVPEIVEKLEQARTALADVNVDLADHIPSIVVIGDQSTGKSSLLSALTGLQLPTGDNTVTRAPLKIFIRPGKEHKATLQYRLRKPSGLSESKPVKLSASELLEHPERVAEEIREAQDAMHESLKTVRKEAGDQSHWRPHVLGELDGDSWLLKDEINLFVDMPGEKGSFTVVDLPGLHRPMGQEQFTNDLEAWVTEKIKRDNVIILSAMTALSAVGGGKSNLSRANNLAYSVDKEYKRTLSIITKADEASYKVPEVLKVAVSKSSNHGSRTGCVLVATHPYTQQGATLEDTCLQGFKTAAEFKDLEAAGGGLGVPHLFDKLVQLQEEMIMNLDLSGLIKELQTKLVDVNGSLKGYESLPGDEEAAEKEFRSLLNLVEHSYCNVCLNVAGVDESRAIREAMKMAMRDAERRYVQKQSAFIPGILGRKKVLKDIMKAVDIDTTNKYSNLLSEYTAVQLFQEFHKHVADDGLQFVDEALQATEDAVVALLKHHLQAYPDLATAAEAAAREVLLTYQDPLYAAVRDVTHSFSYVVETLHSEVLYMTFERLLLLASGILVTPQDYTKVKQLMQTQSQTQMQVAVQSDDGDIAAELNQAADYVYRKDKHGNPSDAGSIVGGMVGSLSAIALSMVVGPFAGPLGMGIGFLTTEAWDAFRNVLQKYKEKYKAKKEQSSERLAAQVVPGYVKSEFQEDLVPLPWPEHTDPMTSFELMCKLMNCDPGYVVQALEFYYKAFESKLREVKLNDRFSAAKLQEQFTSCLARMLCTHYAMTESVSKLVRMRLMSTHTHAPRPGAEMPMQSLPTLLGGLVLHQLFAEHKDKLLPLMVGSTTTEVMAKLKQQQKGVEAAIKHIKAAC